MPKVLIVAAGGGGDVIGAAMVAEALGLTPDDAIIATVAWERLLIDPVPGPCPLSEFVGLQEAAGTFEVLPTTTTRPPRGSLLPRLRAELGYRTFLLDLAQGVTGLVDQLGALHSHSGGVTSVWLVDVGGDVLADGSEPGLRSPLCDAMTLAATAEIDPEARVLVAGLGLDGELTVPEVRQRLGEEAQLMVTLSDPSPSVSAVLEWHPTEASALLAASAMGIRGVVEVRDAGTPIELTDCSPEVWTTAARRVADTSLAGAVRGTTSLEAAAAQLNRRAVTTELEHERNKADRLDVDPVQLSDRDTLRRVRAFERDALDRGSRYTTFRRLAEHVQRPRQFDHLRATLIADNPQRLTGPLWRLE